MPSLSQLHQVYGPWAVVTGASSGIGASFTTYLASLGFSVVLIARRIDYMDALASTIREAYPAVSVKVVGVDLTSSSAMDAVARAVDSLDVGLVVNNAGVELPGNFLQHDSNDHDRVIDLNVTAYTRVTHFFGRHMATRRHGQQQQQQQREPSKRGGMIMISSINASATPYCASYSASKAFVSTLGLCVAEEWRSALHIDVTVIEPGPVMTEMLDRGQAFVRTEDTGLTAMEADELVKTAVSAFARGRRRVTPGVRNQIMQLVMGVLPERVRVAMTGYIVAKTARAERIVYQPESS